LIGLTLLIIAIASAMRRIKRDVLNGSHFGPLRLTFMLTILFYNITESIFDRQGILWFVLILMMMLEARTVPVRAVSESPRRLPNQTVRPALSKVAVRSTRPIGVNAR
jgi:hypothetical protein